jgi:methyltransferase (TIGR00027 family)
MRDEETPDAPASRTAAGSATWRAIGTLERDPGARNPDTLARLFLPPSYAVVRYVPCIARAGNRVYEKLIPGGYCFETARTKHMDLALREQIQAGVSQIVILGAGYDTRAQRFASLLGDAAIYEVDMPAVQERKQRRLAAYTGPSPPGLRYVPVDRDHHNLFERLLENGYDSERRTLFIWSGVVMYLRPPTVDRTLTEIRQRSAVGSVLVFDYFSSGAVAGGSDEYGAKQVSRRVEKLGEPLAFGVDPPELAELLSRHGFEVVSNLGPADLTRRYLQLSSGGALGRPFGFAFIAEARSAPPGRRGGGEPHGDLEETVG